MASVTSIYARAFADVVFEKRLDAAKTLQRRSLRPQFALQASPDLRGVWETPSIPADQKRRVAGCDCHARRSLPAGEKLCGGADRSPANASFSIAIVTGAARAGRAHGFCRGSGHQCRDLNDGEKANARVASREAYRARRCGPDIRDASILGGAIVRVGSTIYDGSVIGQLETDNGKLLALSL